MNDKFFKFFGLDKVETVSWKDLDSVPYNVWVDMETGSVTEYTSGVRYKRFPSSASGQLLFLTEIDPERQYPMHIHAFKEKLYVIDGKLLLPLSNMKLLNKDEEYTIGKNVKHIVRNPSKTQKAIAWVEFRPY